MSSNRVETRKAQISAAIKTLKESTNLQEKCQALSCIQSATAKSGTQDVPSESQLREICKLVINAFTSGNKILYSEASCTLIAILRSYKDRELNLFNELMQINFENRVKIFQLFEELQDDAIKAVSRDTSIVDFLRDCLASVTPEKMEWLSPTVCTDNIKPLQILEYENLSSAEQVEERITVCILDLLYRLYKLSTSPFYAECAKFSVLFVDKIATLAYMGHKRQRTPAIKVLQLPNMGHYIRNSSPAIWQEFKSTLQNIYCQRMAVLVGACEPDWSTLWTTSVQLLGTDLHRGAGLINNLLSVEEKAFKSVDTVVRRQAFLSWKLIVDNFALDEQELATARRVKLLCIPLNAKNSKTESMTLTKMEVWWHLIFKLYKHIDKFTNPVLTQFLNFCFGPLGDTPLLSSKFNVIASPGKRFSKTKLVAIDALLQLLTDNEDDLKMVASSLEEKLPEPISSEVFQDCFKAFTHSVGEACLALAQLGHRELETRVQIIAALWKTLFARVTAIKDEAAKVQMYKEIMLLIIELSEHSESKPVIRDSMLDIVLPSLDEFPPNYIFHFETIVGLMNVFTKPAILNKIMRKQQELIKRLLWRGVKPPQVMASYVPNSVEVFKRLVKQLDSIKPTPDNLKGTSVLWNILSEMVTKYMIDGLEMNEGDAAVHDFTTVKTLIKFPFTQSIAPECWQHKKIAIAWRALYKQFDLQASLVPTVKPNEFVAFTVAVIQQGVQCDNRCAGFAVTCLDGILTTMNYKHVLDENGFLPIVKLMNDLCIINLTDGKPKDAEAALRELSSVLITLYGHAPNKVVSCLEAVRPATEHMLKPCQEDGLVKEIASTWETIMSIFKGLGGHLSPDLIVSFQDAIRLALRHNEPEIVSQTLSCLETEEYMNGPTKEMVQGFLKEINLDKAEKGSDGAADVPENGQKQVKPAAKLTGSFLNRKIAPSPRPATPTQRLKDGRKSPFFPEPESQDYVVIKSDFKFDAKRLTEHQKESLLRRREDIPALYNDLSQSCSQDTQNIQEWFDKKKTELDKSAATNSPNSSDAGPAAQTEAQSDANKENKLDREVPSLVKDKTKPKDAEESKIASDKKTEAKKAAEESMPGNLSADETLFTNKDLEDNPDANQSVAKKLDFESRTEFPDDGSSAAKSSEVPSTSKNRELAEEKTKKSKKTKDPETAPQDLITQETGSRKESKRGVKRKATGTVSDSDSEGNNVASGRRKRKIATPVPGAEAPSDSDSVKSTESEQTMKQLSRRTKTEMSRLQINMVFDKQFSTLPSRRRSKIHYEDDCEVGSDEREASETTKTTRNRVSRIATQESAKPRVKTSEKDPKNPTGSKPGRKRGRRPKNAPQDETPAENTPPEISLSQLISTSPEEQSPDRKTEQPKLRESPESKNDQEMGESGEPGITDNANAVEDNPEPQSCNDSEEIVESSQASSVGSISLDKKYNKPCFIRINKIKGVQPGQSVLLDLGKEKIKKGEEDDPVGEKPQKDEQSAEIQSSNLSEKSPESKSHPPTPSVMEVEEAPVANAANSSSPELRPAVTDASFSPVRLASSMLNSGSPKNSAKRYPKLKSVATQGRAAHMLGLVTKQAIAESRPEVFIEEEIPLSKKRGKEGEEDGAQGKKERILALKEPERHGSPSGSRQEKIFNKMRITPENEAAPTVSSLFGNLRNDGEKSSPGSHSDKDRRSSETGAHGEKTRERNDEDNTSPVQEKEMLPMLEWSSANPPSLTASPSASILKRQRQLQVDNDLESPTACKRKRVSFADPPVSKEMGYEIPASAPAHRMSKVSGSRVLLQRKDSPVRLKQTKIKLVQSSPAKSDKEREIETEKSVASDAESQMTRTITDDDVETTTIEDSDSPVIIFPENENEASNLASEDKTESFLHGTEPARVTIDNLAMEVEIGPGSRDPKRKDKEVVVMKEASTAGRPNPDETETQRDIFDNTEVEDRCKTPKTDPKRSPKAKTSPDEASLRCVDINVLTNPENNSTKSQSSLDALEDTVDIQNVTGLNSTTNSDEIFCSRPVRTSTQSVDAEGDTLPVTDSVFSNLPFSQSTQATNDTMELDQPELLDSTRSIYPSLMESSTPIDSVIGHLVDPMWKSHLSSYLHSKGIQTVGDLAQLTEREVNWIPVKRSPRVPFIKNVLQHFEKSVVSLPSIASTADVSQESVTTTPNASISSLPPSSTPIAQSSSLCEPLEQPAAGYSLDGSITRTERVTKSTETQVSVQELLEDMDPTVVLKSAIKRCSAESILANYKLKMKNMAEEDLERETIKMLGIELKNHTDAHLKSVCRAAGLSKVLGRLPDIFSQDNQFFSKVLTAYRQKIKVSDCIQGLDFEEIKSGVCQKCTSSDLAEMLSKKLKEEEEAGVTTPMTELSSLQAMLKRMPKDLIISHTVANEELISPLTVLDIALQNNAPVDISSALEGQPSSVRNRVFGDLCTIKALSSQIEERNLPEETLTEMLKTISKKLDAPKLLDAFNAVMKDKFSQLKRQEPTSSSSQNT